MEETSSHIYVCIHVYIYIYMYACIHTYIHTHVHTYILFYILFFFLEEHRWERNPSFLSPDLPLSGVHQCAEVLAKHAWTQEACDVQVERELDCQGCGLTYAGQSRRTYSSRLIRTGCPFSIVDLWNSSHLRVCMHMAPAVAAPSPPSAHHASAYTHTLGYTTKII